MGFEELKLETTAEERALWSDLDRLSSSVRGIVQALVGDIATTLAEVARLKAELAEVESAVSSVRLCQCELTREIEVLVDGKGCELHEESDGTPLTSTQVAAALKFYQERVRLVENEAAARETTARSSELRYLSTFTPILDKRVQTTEQLFGWMAACEAWRAAIAARRAP